MPSGPHLSAVKTLIPPDLGFSWASLREFPWPTHPSPVNDPIPKGKTIAPQLWSQNPRVQTLAPSFTSMVISGTLLDCSKPQFLRMSNEDQNSTCSSYIETFLWQCVQPCLSAPHSPDPAWVPGMCCPRAVAHAALSVCFSCLFMWLLPVFVSSSP